MQIRSMHFKARAGQKLADVVLQENLRKAKSKFVDMRALAIAELDDFEATREAAKVLRDRTLNDLDLWLERFELEATRRGATVLWAKDGAEVCQRVVDIARRHGVKKVTKSKSMLSEEAGLNEALEAAGIQPVETDLGEYILQINDNEPPSHIIAPVFHKRREEVSALFARVHQLAPKTEIEAMTREAREVLRPHFLSADMGISGGNFLVAETGSVALVTNEGNGRMVTTLPRVHVVVTGIEKVIPTLEDLATLMRLLPRSATGQSISNYFSLLTGVKQADEQDGPAHMYFVLVDNGRADLVGGEFAEMLRCKLAWSGGTLVEVPAAYSSQTCSECCAVDAKSRRSQSSFACTSCGFSDHADLNAAKVLLARANRSSALPVDGSACKGPGRSRKRVGLRVPRRSLESPPLAASAGVG